MFSLKKEAFGEYELYHLNNGETGESCTVIPDYGAVLHGLTLRKNGSLYELIDAYTDAIQISENQFFKSSHLIPFPNRVDKGLYKFNGQTYRLTPNLTAEDNAIHGLVFDKKFDAKFEQNERSAMLTLQYDFEGTPGFPFPFLTTIMFTLQAGQLSCNVLVRNIGNQGMPMGVGWHPYFKLGDKKVNDLSLKLPEGRRIEMGERMIPTGNLQDYNQFRTAAPIGQTPFDTGFYVNNNGEEAITTLFDEERQVTLLVSQKNCPYLQIYIPPSRNSIAIEPMTCAPDAFNNGLGLETLKSGEHIETHYSVTLK